MEKPKIFEEDTTRVAGFVSTCKIYINNKIGEATLREKIFWTLSLIQGRIADVWKKNIINELEAGKQEFESVEEFLEEIRKEFGRGDEELVKVAELKRLEQGGRKIEEFVQKFKKMARGSGYKR